MGDLVELECIRVGSRLRVRILSEGYFSDANCQFPRDIRVAGARYTAPRGAVTFVQGVGKKYYYRVRASSIERVLLAAPAPPRALKVYGDDDDEDCLVCMDAAKAVVLVPCGHYCMCAACAGRVGESCPMCRGAITHIVSRVDIATIG